MKNGKKATWRFPSWMVFEARAKKLRNGKRRRIDPVTSVPSTDDILREDSPMSFDISGGVKIIRAPSQLVDVSVPVRFSRKPRKCKGCSAKLSIYNPTDHCSSCRSVFWRQGKLHLVHDARYHAVLPSGAAPLIGL